MHNEMKNTHWTIENLVHLPQFRDDFQMVIPCNFPISNFEYISIKLHTNDAESDSELEYRVLSSITLEKIPYSKPRFISTQICRFFLSNGNTIKITNNKQQSQFGNSKYYTL